MLKIKSLLQFSLNCSSKLERINKITKIVINEAPIKL